VHRCFFLPSPSLCWEMQPEGDVGTFPHSRWYSVLLLYFAKMIIIKLTCVIGETTLCSEKIILDYSNFLSHPVARIMENVMCLLSAYTHMVEMHHSAPALCSAGICNMLSYVLFQYVVMYRLIFSLPSVYQWKCSICSIVVSVTILFFTRLKCSSIEVRFGVFMAMLHCHENPNRWSGLLCHVVFWLFASGSEECLHTTKMLYIINILTVRLTRFGLFFYLLSGKMYWIFVYWNHIYSNTFCYHSLPFSDLNTQLCRLGHYFCICLWCVCHIMVQLAGCEE
jgi:hypothetical protein